MAKISNDRKSGNRHPRENILGTGNLAAVNAEIVIDCDGCSTIGIDVRGTFVGTIVLEGTLDNFNYELIVVRAINRASTRWLVAIPNALAPAIFHATNPGYDRVRVRMSAFTSGAAIVNVLALNTILDQELIGSVTTDIVTATGAAAAAVTATLAAPGAGLRHYITYLGIVRFASAALTAGAAPVLVTSTNIPGALVVTIPAEAALQGTVDRWREDFAYPVAVSAQNTATTVVAPATPGVIWRLTVGFYVGP